MKVTRAQLASIFGVTPPAIDGWRRRGCPVSEPSTGVGRGRGAKYWTPDVLAWYVREVVLKDQGGDDDSESAKGLRTRLLRAQTETAEFELAKLRADLLTVGDWDDTVSAAFARVGARIKSIAPKLAAAAVGVESLQEGLARVEPVIEELLHELAAGDDVPVAAADDEAEATAA